MNKLHESEEEKKIQDKLSEYIKKVSSSDRILFNVGNLIQFLNNNGSTIISTKQSDIFEYSGEFDAFLKVAGAANTKIIYYQGFGRTEDDPEEFIQLKSSEEVHSSWGGIFFFKNVIGDIHLFVTTQYYPPYRYFTEENSIDSESSIETQDAGEKLDLWAQEILENTLYKNARNEKQRKAAISEFIRIKKSEEDLKYINEWELSQKIELIKLKKESSAEQKKLA